MSFLFEKAWAAGLFNPYVDPTLCSLLTNITTGIIEIGAAISGVMIMIGAFHFLFSAGDPKKVELGKKTILYTVIGYAILVGSSAIVYIVSDLLGGGVTPAC